MLHQLITYKTKSWKWENKKRVKKNNKKEIKQKKIKKIMWRIKIINKIILLKEQINNKVSNLLLMTWNH
jgi:hypothetical protein